jgi:hypothetical protein
MYRQFFRGGRAVMARQCASGLLLLSGLLVLAPLSRAQVDLGPVTVGAGLRTSYVNTEPSAGNDTNQFLLNDIRLYVNGPVYKDIKFMFNTEYNGSTNTVNILDAVARIEVAPMFNIWAGRFLPPSDRANLYGPFYAHEWAVYTDGVQDGYPAIFQGRDNGVVYWGDFAKKIKISGGLFDGGTVNGNSKLIGAARVQIDFWDPEGGYYLNGTYYGDKNLLAIGGATQVQDGRTATTADFLLEKKVGNGGAFTIESEYSNYNGLGGAGYFPIYAKSQGAYVLGSFLIPKQVGVGKFEILGKYAKAEYTHGPAPSFDQKTTEINFNYVIKQFNARIQSFYLDKRFNREMNNYWQAGIGLQIQM